MTQQTTDAHGRSADDGIDLARFDRLNTFDPVTARSDTERISVRDGRVRRYRFSVRTFAFTELHDWLRDAGFSAVEGFDERGEPLGLDSGRIIVVAAA